MDTNHWAEGCGSCLFGLAFAPPIPATSMGLSTIRRGQALQGEIVFCECRAGQAYQRFLFGDGPVAIETPLPTMHLAA